MSIKLVFKEENEELFWKYWEDFISHEKKGPRYLRKNIEYRIAVSKGNYLLHSDKSFVYLRNNKVEACVFLPIERCKEFIVASSNLDYIDAPLFLNDSVKEQVFSIIDDIAVEHGLAMVKFAIDPMENDVIFYNYLQKYQYLNTSILTYIINLKMASTSDDLFKACRRGHRREIKKIRDDKNFSTFIMNSNNFSYKLHEEYRLLHHKCAGRITRPKETFDLQFEKVKEGCSVLVGLKYKNKNIAFYYFDYYSNKALGFSSADDPEYNSLPLYHLLFLRVMEYLKKTGVHYIDAGQPSSPSTQIDYYPDKKQLNIAFFKRGFGGHFKDNFRGIKYFSKDLFKKDIKEFIDNYSQTIA